MTMNAIAGALPCLSDAVALSRAEAYAHRQRFDYPTLVMECDAVLRQYQALARGLGAARIHYALKANPMPQILTRLAAAGCGFDAASRVEIEACLAAGAAPHNISFGNTIKRASDIAFAFGQGVRLFAADAAEELEKIARHAPGAQVYIRLLVDNPQADWPLGRKFGCDPAMALDLLALARALGLQPVGLSFHVGSQTRQARMWAGVLDQVAQVWQGAQARGFALSLLNIGGGFPAGHGTGAVDAESYAAEVVSLIRQRFHPMPDLLAEPGRGLVAEAGAIAAEVLLVSRKSDAAVNRWVYLDIGRFSGLAETEGEAIRYDLLTDRDGGATGPCILAGPSCDSADVLYERQPVQLPLDLRAGDRVILRHCGAYTATYASVGFNGFPPLDVVAI
ncbi:MAG: type III PLP-dependent enzyme [Pelagimonas sp.]|jgi:ornithine decarboxylase|nr:type III PLP-dependent enzyme [Pelagimonas sp.]